MKFGKPELSPSLPEHLNEKTGHLTIHGPSLRYRGGDINIVEANNYVHRYID